MSNYAKRMTSPTRVATQYRVVSCDIPAAEVKAGRERLRGKLHPNGPRYAFDGKGYALKRRTIGMLREHAAPYGRCALKA